MVKEAVVTRPKESVRGTDGVGMTTSGELMRLEGLEFPHEGKSSEKRGWYVVNSLLGAYEAFPQTSTVTTHVQERLNLITGGKKATAIVIHNDEPNAMAIPGYVVVTDGILKIIEHQEELDGLLAHEYIHLDHEHATDRSETGTEVGEIGRSRSHETEADLMAMELLDRRGINVRGMMMLFEKMETNLPKKKEDSKFKMGDITHGSLLDRRLNLEEMLWLMDVRSVSGVFTPSQLESTDLEQYQKDEELINNWDNLDPLVKSHFIHRQFRKIGFSNQYTERPLLKANQLVELQRKVLQEVATDLTNKEIDNLLAVSVVNMFPVRSSLDKGTYVEYPEGIKATDLFRTIDSKQEVLELCSAIESPVLQQLGVSINRHERARAIDDALASYVISQETLEINDYAELVDAVQPIAGNMYIGAAPLISYLDHTNGYGTIIEREVSDYLADSTIPSTEIDYITGTQAFDEDGNRNRSQFVRVIEEKRISKALKIKEPIEFFKHIGKYRNRIEGMGEEALVWQRKIGEKDTDITFPIVNRVGSIVEGITVKKMLNKLKTYSMKNELTQEDFTWLSMIGRHYSRAYTEGLERFYEVETGEEEGSLVELKPGSISDRCLLWAIGMNKNAYLDQVTEDINLLKSRFNDKRSVDDLVETIISAPLMAQEMGFPFDWEVTPEDLNKIDAVTKLILKYTLGPYSRNPDRSISSDNNASGLVRMLEDFYVGAISSGRFPDSNDYANMADKWNYLLEQKISNSEMTDQDLLELFALGCITENVQVNLQVPSAALEQLVRRLSFDGGMELIFDRFSHLPHHLFSQAIDYLVEHKARTPNDFAQLEEALKERIESFVHNDELIGKVALADGLLVENYALVEPRVRKMGVQKDTIRGMEPVRLLKALLTTSIDDSEFKKYLFERWWLRYRTDRGVDDDDTDIRGHFQIEDIAVWRPARKESRLKFWANDMPKRGSYNTMAELQSNTYLASTAVKYYALRKILTGEGGVLNDQEGREGLINAFLEGWVDFDDLAEGENAMKELLTSLFTVADKEELYQRINPILMDLILRIPEHAYPYKELAREIARQELTRMGQDGHVRNPNERDEDFLTRKIYTLMTGGGEARETLDIDNSVTRLLSLFTDSQKPADDRRLTPIELAVMVGEKAGAVGVRVLQLAGQYFDVPEQERERFSNVYDAMKGQTRLQAYRILKREAEFSPEVATLMDEVVEIKPRIGGGSLMTVYEVVLQDGRREAVAVKNPNVEYHVGKIIDSLKRTMEYTREHNPDNKDYQLFEVLLSDVQEWIINELVDPRFEEKDIQFRMQNDSRFGQYDSGRNKYNILVPQSSPTGTRWVRREEFVEGANLTSLVPTDDETNIAEGKINKDDHKQVVSLLVRNYIYQLTDTGLVHSDIHPGNFRITSDNANIAVFDRYNLLELDSKEQSLIQSLIPQIAVGGVKAALEHTVNYLFDHERNSDLLSIKDEILAEVTQNGTSSSLERSIMDAVVVLKQRGIHVPLTISLIAKNLFALNSLAQEAGFNGITDAYTATAGNEELMKLLWPCRRINLVASICL